jgi:hypothetical protein
VASRRSAERVNILNCREIGSESCEVISVQFWLVECWQKEKKGAGERGRTKTWLE